MKALRKRGAFCSYKRIDFNTDKRIILVPIKYKKEWNMSHFTVFVLISKEEYEGDIAAALEKRLAPFDENMQVKPYEVDCYCVESQHRNLVFQATKDKLGYDYGDLRETFKDKRKGVIKSYFESLGQEIPENIEMRLWPNDDFVELDELLDSAWDKHRNEYEQTEADFTKNIPMPSAKKDCEDCHGTGKHDSRYNPNSQWDWYSVGGRWSGALEELEGLSSVRYDNSALTCEVAGKYAPFAILDIQGQWHEKGSMGWFGMASDEKPKNQWELEAQRILSEAPKDSYAILVDCHI